MDFQFLNPARLFRQFGKKITDSEGVRRDTGVTELAEEVAAVMGARQTIDLTNGPITINNYTNGPAITINNLGPENQTQGVQVTNEAGETAGMGIGIGNINLVANEYFPLQTATFNQQYLQYAYYAGNVITYQQAQNLGIPTPPAGPGRLGTQVFPGFAYQTGQPYPPGATVGPLGQSGQVGGSGGTPGFPFTLWPPFSMNPITTIKPPTPTTQIGGGSSTGYTGTLDVVTDVTWDEATCEMTKTTSTLDFVDGLLMSVT